MFYETNNPVKALSFLLSHTLLLKKISFTRNFIYLVPPWEAKWVGKQRDAQVSRGKRLGWRGACVGNSVCSLSYRLRSEARTNAAGYLHVHGVRGHSWEVVEASWFSPFSWVSSGTEAMWPWWVAAAGPWARSGGKEAPQAPLALLLELAPQAVPSSRALLVLPAHPSVRPRPAAKIAESDLHAGTPGSGAC